MALKERDPHTGYLTTGHEWNGIKELNRPVPRVILIFLAITVIFSVIWWILLPAWPLGSTYTKGLLGVDQRDQVHALLEQAAAERAPLVERIVNEDYATIQQDTTLMGFVRGAGRSLFGDNCGACHGLEGTGGPGYPDLTDDAWLWGGSPEAVAETIRVGINATHPETRFAQMLAFGRDMMLDRPEILDVVSYVQSLSDPEIAANQPDAVAAGRETFATSCASCHGDDATGNVEFGAPDLTDDFWLYGGDRQSIYTSVFHGRAGHMPAWEGRLTPAERKLLTLYVLDLGAEP